MIKFQKNNNLKINNEELKKKVKEIYELTDKNDILGYATINESIFDLIYIYVKKEHRGNRIWTLII